MRYPGLNIETARNGLEARRSDSMWSGIDSVRQFGTGVPDFDESCAASLLRKLNTLKDQFGVDSLGQSKGKDFEARASGIVHSELSSLDADTATSREFWLWLTFVACRGDFFDLVVWRFGDPVTVNPVNFGITTKSSIREGLFARLWWRGNIGFDPTSDPPYTISRRGDIDIWRSHIIRQEYGRCRNVVKSLIRYQHPDEDLDNKTLDTQNPFI